MVASLPFATAHAQTPIVNPHMGVSSKIAPAYFGPNAFPVPEMLDDAISSKLEASVAGAYHWGDYGDQAVDAMFRLRIPLFTPRANFVLWVPVEHFSLTQEWKEHARIPEHPTNKGTKLGAAFLSTDILILKESRRRPAIAVRAAMKTASEGDWTTARYYDCPGYFFDGAFGKGISFSGTRLSQLRLGASAGFLCWQTNNGRQNDATMYAVELKAKFHHVELLQNFRGYSGWEGDGDRPKVVKTQLTGHFTSRKAESGRKCPVFSPFVFYEKGLYDYPYQQISAGLTMQFDILPAR